jgi:two-component system, chemotaxis family, sensor kinase CheA
MDDLLRDFVVETTENIDVVDSELVRFERDPNNTAIIAQIFRLVHTIKGTCGFLGLPRLEALTHAAETAIDRFRDGAPVTRDAVTLILSTIDRIKVIMAELDRSMTEPAGEDKDLIQALETLSSISAVPNKKSFATQPLITPAVAPATDFTVGNLVYQILERELRPGEVSLDELERVFRETSMDEEEFGGDQLDRAGFIKPEEPRAPVLVEKLSAVSVAADDANADGQGGEMLLRKNTIRVPVDTLEHLMTMVSELVLTRNQLLEIARRDENSAFKVPLQRLSHVTAELQESVMKTRMQPIGSAWAKLPRLIRDLCHELGKDIDLETKGADTEIDRQLLELIKDPMLHMLRNAADHGIELPGDRIKAGKPPRGSIKVTAAQEGGYIVLSIADDGRGLDLLRIRQKAITLGLTSEVEAPKLTDQQLAKFVFNAGFSTADRLTNISGRGVGMDVVRTNIEQMGGAIDIKTKAGYGTTVDIKIPLTLAIAAALIVESAGQRFALPQIAVIELVRPSGSNDARIEHLHSSPVLRLRERLLPLIQLSHVLSIPSENTKEWSEAIIVVCQVGSIKFGIVVDSVLQTEEIVVKPVSARIRHLSCYSGATILGDGAVIMILDPNGLAQSVGTLAEAHNDNSADRAGASDTGEEKTSLLVFRAGSGGPKAVPLAMVTRLEEIDVTRIESANGQRLVQYRGKLMRLVACQDDMEIKDTGTQPVLVFSNGNTVVGLMVDDIIDIVEDVLDIGMGGEAPGVIGSAILRDRATDIIDVAYFVPEFGQSVSSRLKKRRTLLLVESSDFLRAMLAPVLQAAGFVVHQAVTVGEAERRIGSQTFDFVVANVEIGSAMTLTGLAGPETRFVGLATRASREIMETAHRAGFDDVVGTFDREGLLASLGSISETLGEAA